MPPTPLLDSALTRARTFETTKDEETPSLEDPERKPSASASSEASGDPAATSTDRAPEPAPDLAAQIRLPLHLESLLQLEEIPALEAKPINSEKPVVRQPERSDPGDDWVAELERLRDVARRRAHEPGEQPEHWERRLLLLDGLADNKDSEGVWGSILSALPIVSGRETPDSTVASERLRQATEAIDARTPLEIVELRLCRKVQGFGIFETVDKDSLHAGQSVLIYCELAGLKSESEAGEYHSKLSSRVEIVERGKEAPIWTEQIAREDRCRRRRRDVFVNYRITVPPDLAPGEYEVRLTQTDDLAGRSVAAAIEVRVQP